MKRVFKFRAYTEISNEVLGMKYDVPHDYNDTVMQFTGLLDRNGKEIYEGDIVSTSFWYHGSEKTEFIEKPLIGQVQYWGECHGSYNLLDKTGGSIPIEWACHKNDGWKIYGEIIGNIYENLELLENK